ncbi:hypothetical protein [Anaerocolumna sp. MB42-C2]|uniref:glycoside hydrolase family 38 N-terminal domain-containing protein n=1 Tax=Anaerocolumna sp. MB42-C2 TaxID=3070997 RepID=UPI0027E122A1|nr:hypothetical protein [Anaerocolumna sp. MB42-C2]WMJ89168.1 hypothetical protein RBU59_06485 [Anaerocolumna sp. MB42-C2]
MKKKFTIYLLHLSHTDVGYTDTQEKMKAHHIAFIREVLQLIKKNQQFVWNCESYWCVQQFLRVASKQEKAEFIAAVNSGNIGLSANYLNLTDLVPAYVQNEIMQECSAERAEMGLTAKSAITADINGYSWGYADILAQNGVENLMSCIHTHHGYHPLFKKQAPFYWESPQGKRILCWNGDHYNLGNELGIAQAAWFEYTLQDGMTSMQGSDFEKAVKRINAYVSSLLGQKYPYTFAPVSLSGNMTDNSPPSLKILEFVQLFNSQSDDIQLKMCTLDEFFTRLMNESEEIPVYSGDWTDWWADGIGSTPADVIQYRNAARSFHVMQKMKCKEKEQLQPYYYETLHNLMFYGEHTWGYSSSITEPFHPQVNNLDQWKRLYALKASEAVVIMRENVQQSLGETAISLHKTLKLRAVNPHTVHFVGMFTCDLEHFYGYSHFEVIDDESGDSVPFQISSYSRGPKICIWLSLAPGQTKTFALKELPERPLVSAGRRAPTGIEGINDLYWRLCEDLENGGCISIDGIENKFFKIDFEIGKGISSIYSKQEEKELINIQYPYAAFTPVYEVTDRDITEDYLQVRRNMGRNRKAARTHRSEGKLYDVKVLENGMLYSRSELKYHMDGVQECSLIVTAYKLTPKIDFDFRVHKNSIWEPENLYLALPFTAQEIFIDKAGAILRPRIDQLPGTCVDFYAVQNGVAFCQEDSSVLITTPDSPLVSYGTLKAHPIKLMGEGSTNCDEVYSWVMNNFWETNFKASLGGFYQFSYSLNLMQGSSIAEIFKTGEALNENVLQFYMFNE